MVAKRILRRPVRLRLDLIQFAERCHRQKKKENRKTISFPWFKKISDLNKRFLELQVSKPLPVIPISFKLINTGCSRGVDQPETPPAMTFSI